MRCLCRGLPLAYFPSCEPNRPTVTGPYISSTSNSSVSGSQFTSRPLHFLLTFWSVLLRIQFHPRTLRCSESDVVVLRQTKHGRLACSSIPIRLGDYTFMGRPRCLGAARDPTKRSRDLPRCGQQWTKSLSHFSLVIIY